MGKLSAVAIHKRLLASEEWLRWLADEERQLLGQKTPSTLQRLRAVDALAGRWGSRPAVLGEIRTLVGHEALLTLVFDRGGFSFELFQWMKEQPNLRFITYDKSGRHERCLDEHFAARWVSVPGGRETYKVCDRIET